ncbi:hypothetical protein SAMN05421505_1412 [Sinosporangium album]|uniref:Uncharacterized protein n=1 Tax=Sinosporangium album TaxID=504805 RepID=A0A1G8J4I3_9ACTN|nr:hypothetical protein SAMN05421505_1412 [Sinosporangium album]
MLQLQPEDLSASDRPMQHPFVEHNPERRRVRARKYLLPLHPCLDQLFYLLLRRAGYAPQYGSRIVLGLQQSRNKERLPRVASTEVVYEFDLATSVATVK